MKKRDYIKIIKIGLGTAIAILIAESMGLKYSPAAGIIALLTIQDTKKATMSVALKRLISLLSALVISKCVFSLLGYHAISFGIFILIFVAISYRFKLEDGISLNGVLITHILIQQSMTMKWIVNESLLFFIGVSIGILLNLYIPSKKKEIQGMQRDVEEKMKDIIKNMSQSIIGKNSKDDPIINFKFLDQTLNVALSKAYDNMNNTLTKDTRYYIDYIDMRQNQTLVLKKIYENIELLTLWPKQCYPISELIIEICNTYHEYNNVRELISKLKGLKKSMQEEQLPITRDEFENRAILFVVLSDFENFLQLKAEFVKNLTVEQLDTYWNIGVSI